MLIFSQGLIKVNRRGDVRMWGVLKSFEGPIREFLKELQLRDAIIKYRDGRLTISKNVDASTQQRIRNYIGNLPALRKLR